MNETLHVLSVDDDYIIQMLHKRLIQKEGLHADPIGCENGKAALDIILNRCDKQHVCIVLLDINMPVMNGWEFLNELNIHEATIGHVFVIMVTSSVDPQDKIKAKNYKNIIGFIEKPLTPASIQQIKNLPELAAILDS